jgi:hypothetical protein
MKKPYISAEGWQKYFTISCFNNGGRSEEVWIIFYSQDNEHAGHCVPDYGPYRTERLAIRGVERLYRKVIADFESIVLGA